MIRQRLLSIATILSFIALSAAPLLAEPLYGPKTYTRATGQSTTYTGKFSQCEPQAKYELRVINGLADGSQRLSSATVILNGQEVLHPNELNQNVDKVEKPVTVLAENTLEARLASSPNGQIAVSIECVENCFGVTITSPPGLSTINRADILVKGTVTTDAEEAGIVVNNVVAQVYGNQFAANKVPLGLGVNTIIASATNSCGQKAETQISIQANSTDQRTLLTAHPAGGAPPLAVTLHATAALTRPVTQYQWDLTGDGIIDTSGAALTDLSTTFAVEGLYFPTVIITDNQQHQYTETAVINVFSQAQVNALILRKWEGMRTAMKNKDVEGAVAFYADTAKEMYRQNFTLMKDILPQMAADLGTPRFVRFVENGAFYELTAVRDGQEYSFHVEFVKDMDGLWKIRFF